MKKSSVALAEAVGRVLSHDVTRIVRGQSKGPLLRKGHVICPDDVGPLREIGKEHVFVLELEDGDVHEDDAGVRLGKAAAGHGVRLEGPKESRVNLIAAIDGLLKVDAGLVDRVNDIPDVCMATLPTNTPVKSGDMVAATKVVPLVVPEETVRRAESVMGQGSLVQVKPFNKVSVSLVITGSEVSSGLVEDTFGPVLAGKLAELGSSVVSRDVVTDDPALIASRIRARSSEGSSLVMVTGGMSVDPDDATPMAIRLSGTDIVQYGTPVMPGAMFLLGYLGPTVVMGIPACAMFFRTTVLDLVLPRILAGERLSRGDILQLGYGGLCRSCQPCRFPRCSFGAGGR